MRDLEFGMGLARVLNFELKVGIGRRVPLPQANAPERLGSLRLAQESRYSLTRHSLLVFVRVLQ